MERLGYGGGPGFVVVVASCLAGFAAAVAADTRSECYIVVLCVNGTGRVMEVVTRRGRGVILTRCLSCSRRRGGGDPGSRGFPARRGAFA